MDDDGNCIPLIISPEEKERLLSKYKEPGWVQLKEEFIDFNHTRTVSTQYMPKNVAMEYSAEVDSNSSDKEPPKKKSKLRGRNKKRPIEKKIAESKRLCSRFVNDNSCSFGNECKFSHDVEEFMKNKPEDIGDECPLFKVYGYCRFGLSCCFAKNHLSENYTNIINDELWEEMKSFSFSTNALVKDVQTKLWKKKYDFTQATTFVKDLYALDKKPIENKVNDDEECAKLNACDWSNGEDMKKENHQNDNSTANDTSKQLENNEYKTLVMESLKSVEENSEADPSKEIDNISTMPSSDIIKPITTDNDASVESNNIDISIKTDNSIPVVAEDINKSNGTNDSSSMKSNNTDKSINNDVTSGGNIVYEPYVKKLDFKDKLYLAPLTTVGNLPFRAVCKSLGADITCSEMAVGSSILQGSASEWALLKRHHSEDIYGVQMLSSHPEIMAKCAQLLVDNCDIDFIDINCGCPIDLIFKKGEGSAMMAHPNKLIKSIKAMKSVIGSLPLTVKLRTGIYEEKHIAHSLIRKLKECDVDLFTLHGRTREQRYTKKANWDYINECAQVASPIPLLGNGDILSYEDSEMRLSNTGVAGVMIGRGALIKPWIFTEIKEQRHWDISAPERLDIIKKYCHYGFDQWGSDQMGVSTTRKFLLEWLSFSTRYVPVGLLERVPVRINEKPPYFVGRSDLETLLSSSNCADWIKISEMFLGPVSDGFQFLPKHKANSYK